MIKKGCILCLFLCFLIGLSAQKRKVQNQPYGDQRLYHFGLTVGLNAQDMLITNSGFTGENGERWFAEIPNYTPGFNVGLISDLYINPYMNLRFTPTIHFGDKNFTFVEQNSGKTFKTDIRSNYLTFPVDMKFSSMRLNDYRPYFIAGVYSSMDLGRKKDLPLLFKPMDYGIQFGIGCDFYLPIVKVCPELRFYFGFPNLIDKDRSKLSDQSLIKYTEAISKVTSRMVILTINFE